MDAGTLPDNYERMVASHLKSRLKDPYSAVINVAAPYRSQCAIGIYGPHHGWAVPVSYNSKNSYGAYVGQKTAYYWISNGYISRVSASSGFCPTRFELP